MKRKFVTVNKHAGAVPTGREWRGGSEKNVIGPDSVNDARKEGSVISTSVAPLMLVGVGRSGTSLLQSIIAAHGDFSVVPETSFFRRYVVPKTLCSTISRNGVDATRSLLLSDKYLERLELDIAAIFDETISASADDLDASMYIRLLRAYAEKSALIRFADKEPRAVESLSLIHDLWPNCKILHIYRDPRDVLASKKKAAWSRSGTAFRHVVVGRIQWCMSQRFKRQVGERTYREIKYEKLLEDPARELRSICEWLGVEYKPEMLEFSAAAAGLVRVWKSSRQPSLVADALMQSDTELVAE